MFEGGNKQQLKSRIHCKLARFLDKIGNTKDVLHQLRQAIQCAPDDPYLLDVYQQFCQKLKINTDLRSRNIINADSETSPDLSHDWALHYWYQNPEIIPLKKG